MLAVAPYTPSMEDFSDHITEAISMGIDPNSAFKLPDGCSFIVPDEDSSDQLLLVLAKHEANSNRNAFDTHFGKLNSYFPPLLPPPLITLLPKGVLRLRSFHQGTR